MSINQPINPQAAAAREVARTGGGQFGHQQYEESKGVIGSLPSAIRPGTVDFSDIKSVTEHLRAGGLDGEVAVVGPSEYGNDDNIGGAHMLYTSAGGRQVAFGKNVVGTSVGSNIGADHDGSYFHTEFDKDDAPDAVVRGTIDDIVMQDHIASGFNQAFATSETFSLYHCEVTQKDGAVQGSLSISEDNDFYRVSYDGSTGEVTVEDEYTDYEIPAERVAEILAEISPIDYYGAEPRVKSVGEVFTRAATSIQEDPDFSSTLAQRMGLS